ncbi:MAG TPA: carboxymuconolactone decarboxylase family protein [Dehalococcoidia bacterium]|nr:carboxymuconolactone decarboxylase family protein [Dehalococcoidia bacterium]
MPRVPYRDRDAVPDDIAQIMDRQLAERGYVLNLYRALANSPGLLRAFGGLGGYLRNGSRLDPALRELAILTVGRLANAPYEFQHHVEWAKRAGISDEQIAALGAWASSPLFDERQRAVMRYAWQATEQVHVADDVAQAAHELLDDECFVDLVAVVAFYNMVVRVLEPLQITLEDEFLAKSH